MSWSLGEIAVLARKAARGAGEPWGIAEEAGWAVHWLCAQGLPGPEALARSLDGGAGLAPLKLGVAMSDAGAAGDIAEPVTEPLLLLPFLGQCAPAGASLRVRIGATELLAWPDGARLEGPVPESGALAVLGTEAVPAPADRAIRVDVAPEAIARLTALAARTYAPATEASRLKGAGAGLIDND